MASEQGVSPDDLLPSALGLRWGMSRVECDLRLAAQSSELHGPVSLPTCDFDEGGRLVGLHIWAHESCYFWDGFYNAFVAEATDVQAGLAAAFDAEEAIEHEFAEHFRRLMEAWSERLGAPTWAGGWMDEDYPVLEEW